MLNSSSKVTAKILLEGAQEILGMEMVQKAIERRSSRGQAITDDLLSNPSFAPPGSYQAVLEEMYGPQGGRGLALRIGRAVFRYGLPYFGEQAGLMDIQFRLLPAPRRLENGLQILARVVAEQSGSEISVSDAGTHWRWRMKRTSEKEWASPTGYCYLVVGLLQEFSTWAGGGRYYRVEETECCASGKIACIYQIEKKSLD